MQIPAQDVHKVGPLRTMVQAKPGMQGGTKVLVTFVDDGDTYNFDPKYGIPPGAVTHRDSQGKPVFTCRIDSIDAPEVDHGKDRPGQVYGPEAGEYLRNLINNHEVTIKVSGQDKHDRNLCQVELEGKGIDTEMVKHGLAMVITSARMFRNSDRMLDLLKAQNQAKAGKVGQWGMAEPPVDPAVWRFFNWPHSDRN
jgi:endonuclease YncB( thermonuclease family)